MTVKSVRESGPNLIITLADDTVQYALKTGIGSWLISGTASPDPDPDPQTGFMWPFDLSLVFTEWEGYPGHKGIDFGYGIANIEGTPIPASNTGTVLRNAWDNGLGWYVMLDHGVWSGDHLYTLYGHMHQQSPLQIGSTVSKGSSVGGIGTTGNSTGNHLHFETHLNDDTIYSGQINPRTFMATYGE